MCDSGAAYKLAAALEVASNGHSPKSFWWDLAQDGDALGSWALPAVHSVVLSRRTDLERGRLSKLLCGLTFIQQTSVAFHREPHWSVSPGSTVNLAHSVDPSQVCSALGPSARPESRGFLAPPSFLNPMVWVYRPLSPKALTTFIGPYPCPVQTRCLTSLLPGSALPAKNQSSRNKASSSVGY